MKGRSCNFSFYFNPCAIVHLEQNEDQLKVKCFLKSIYWKLMLKVNVINICLNTSYPAGIYHFLVSLLLTLNTCQTRVSTESGKSRKSRRGREYQGKTENSMDVREKSGNFIISCDKKENDSFWE